MLACFPSLPAVERSNPSKTSVKEMMPDGLLMWMEKSGRWI